MPKQKPENKLSSEEQFERFLQTARDTGVDLTGDEVERQFKKLSESRKSPQSSSSKDSKK